MNMKVMAPNLKRIGTPHEVKHEHDLSCCCPPKCRKYRDCGDTDFPEPVGDPAEIENRKGGGRGIPPEPPYSKIDAVLTKAFDWPWPKNVQVLYSDICDLFDDGFHSLNGKGGR